MDSRTLLTPTLLGRIALPDREEFVADVSAVAEARSEAQGLRAFWELAIRWERAYPAVVELLEARLGAVTRLVTSV